MAEAVADNVPAKATPIDGKPPLFGLSFLENLSEMTMLRQVGLWPSSSERITRPTYCTWRRLPS